MMNFLHTTLRTVCIVNVILLQAEVLKGIMSVSVTVLENLLNCHLLTCFGCYCVDDLVFCSFFPFLNNCKACCKDLPFVELIYCFLFYFLLCEIVEFSFHLEFFLFTYSAL